jgi:ubiquitin-conjugating enzyme E2 S
VNDDVLLDWVAAGSAVGELIRWPRLTTQLATVPHSAAHRNLVLVVGHDCDHACDVLCWFVALDEKAELEGPSGTPYESYFYNLKLVISGDFPAAPPRGFFLTKIYHPNISTAGEICVNTLKRDWTSDTTLRHVFTVIRCLLIVPFPESSLNDEAGKLFMESYAEYAKRAKLMADVHGRPASSFADAAASSTAAASSGASADGSSPTAAAKMASASADSSSNPAHDDRVLKSSSDNPLRSSNTTQVKAKKKSLKRL